MVVVSGTQFESFFLSEGTACVVVVSGTRFESFFFFARTATHVRARTSILNRYKVQTNYFCLQRMGLVDLMNVASIT